MPKVLRIVNRFNLGGPTYNVAYLTKYMPDDFDTVLVGGLKEDDEASSEFILQSLGLNYEILPYMRRSINFRNDRKSYAFLRGLIRYEKPDIVHTHAAKAGSLGRLAAYNEKVPAIVHTFHGHVFHGYFNPLKTRAFKMIERQLASRTDAIVAISNSQKKDLTEIHRIAPSNKVHVIPLGFDLSRFSVLNPGDGSDFRKEWGINEGECVVGIVGRLTAIKNHKFFINAFTNVKSKSNSRVKAMVVGGGEMMEELIEYSKSKGLNVQTKDSKEPGDIIFTSWIQNVETALSGMDILTLTSINEGTPVSVIEALASGVPVISTDAGGVGDIVQHSISGYVTDQGDVQGFISHLSELIDDPEGRTRMGAAGRKFVLEHYTYKRLVSDVHDLYNSLLDSK